MEKRIALVTGGTGGIGTAICRRLHEDGFRVIAGYYSGGNHKKAIKWQETQQEAGYDIGISYGNVPDFHSCNNCVENIEETEGPISILVNNAGITRDSMFRKMELFQWLDVINANLNGVFHMTRLALDKMIENGYGRIINISSINAQKGQLGQTNYSAAKAGMHGFTKALAQEVARKGITVNTISPGYIATEMIMKIKEDIRNEILKDIPVGRFGEPHEIARIVSFLASEDAGFITGSNIAANGGQHMF